MQTRSRFERLKHAIGRWWRRHIVDECPDSRMERLSLERNVKMNMDLREALRSWEIEKL
ncbi:MAG: hypothetical protein WBX25_33630 [Rhodomicrobium sp.]